MNVHIVNVIAKAGVVMMETTDAVADAVVIYKEMKEFNGSDN